MHPAPGAVAKSGPPHDPVLRTGISVGAALCVLALTWLFVANRVPSLEGFALGRNLAAAVAAGVLLLVPVCRFLKSPGHLFLSGLVAWTMLTLGYGAMENQFPALGERLGTFHLFVLGAVGYGLLGTLVWVARLVLHACQRTTHTVPSPLPPIDNNG